MEAPPPFWEPSSSSPWIHVEGRLFENGVEGRFSLTVAPDGRFAEEHHSPLPRAFGFDGQRSWAADWRGGPWTQSLGEASARRVESAVRFGFLRRPLPAPIPEGLVLDSTTGLPSEFTHRTSIGDLTRWRFTDVRALDSRAVGTTPGPALSWPHRVEVLAEHSGFASYTTEQIETEQLETGRFESRLRPRAVASAKWRIPPSGSVFEVERAPTGHLLIRGVVPSLPPAWFVLDSGAGALVLDRKWITAAGEAAGGEPEFFGEVNALGVGGSVSAQFTKLASLRIGDLNATGLIGVAFDLESLGVALQREIAGILGFDLLLHTALEIDAETPSVRALGAHQLDSLRWQPLLLDHEVPHIRGSYEGEREGIFVLDTGSALELILHTPEVIEQRLLAGRETREIGDAFGAGVGGGLAGDLGRLEWVRAGDIERRDVQTLFARAEFGPLASSSAAGNLGAPFFRGRRIVFDYRNERAAFPPTVG